ncbi:MAG: PilN domain-containing protein, partial [Wujia sp.]
SSAQYIDIESMYYTTYQMNENARQFISELEAKIPSSIYIKSFSSTNEGVSMPCVSTSYDAIADFIMQLKTIDCVDNAYVASISKRNEQGDVTYEFSVTVNYVPMLEDPLIANEAAEETAETTDTEAEEE